MKPNASSHWHAVPIARLSCAVGFAAVASSAHAAWDCPSLVAVTTADATVTSAAVVTPPATVGGIAVTVPMCRVQAVARPSFDSEIKLEVWLPPTATDWTGRLKVNGTGGYAGAIPYARLAQDIGDGFVTAGSNMGHDGGESASWTLNHPEKVKDWGLRAHFSVATAA
jgi:feruloyl esterase